MPTLKPSSLKQAEQRIFANWYPTASIASKLAYWQSKIKDHTGRSPVQLHLEG